MKKKFSRNENLAGLWGGPSLMKKADVWGCNIISLIIVVITIIIIMIVIIISVIIKCVCHPPEEVIT